MLMLYGRFNFLFTYYFFASCVPHLYDFYMLGDVIKNCDYLSIYK